MDAADTMGPALPLAWLGLLPDKFFLYQVDHFFFFVPFFPLSLLTHLCSSLEEKKRGGGIKINK